MKMPFIIAGLTCFLLLLSASAYTVSKETDYLGTRYTITDCRGNKFTTYDDAEYMRELKEIKTYGNLSRKRSVKAAQNIAYQKTPEYQQQMKVEATKKFGIGVYDFRTDLYGDGTTAIDDSVETIWRKSRALARQQEEQAKQAAWKDEARQALEREKLELLYDIRNRIDN